MISSLELHYFSDVLVARHVPVLRLLFHLSEIVVEDFLLVRIDYRIEKIITDAD